MEKSLTHYNSLVKGNISLCNTSMLLHCGSKSECMLEKANIRI